MRVRNDYVGILEPLVYKIELLLHEMSKLSKRINKQVESGIFSTNDLLWRGMSKPIKTIDRFEFNITSICKQSRRFSCTVRFTQRSGKGVPTHQ